jgi:hypothetical protein
VRDIIVAIQMGTMVALCAYFWHDGLTRLAMAQLCYVVATAFLFIRA